MEERTSEANPASNFLGQVWLTSLLLYKRPAVQQYQKQPVKSLAETLVMKILYRAEEVTCLMLKPFGELLNNRASSSYHVKRLQELHSCVHAVSAYCIPAGPYLMPIHCVKLYIGRLSIKHWAFKGNTSPMSVVIYRRKVNKVFLIQRGVSFSSCKLNK